MKSEKIAQSKKLKSTGRTKKEKKFDRKQEKRSVEEVRIIASIRMRSVFTNLLPLDLVLRAV